jgi:hypothetical protein
MMVKVGVGTGFEVEVAPFVAAGDVTRVITEESTGWTTGVLVNGGAAVWSAEALVVTTEFVDLSVVSTWAAVVSWLSGRRMVETDLEERESVWEESERDWGTPEIDDSEREGY